LISSDGARVACCTDTFGFLLYILYYSTSKLQMVWRYGIDSASGIGVKVSDRCGITERALQTLQSMQEMTEHTRHTQLIDDTPQRRHFVIVFGFVLSSMSTAVDVCHYSVSVVL
jgi:hypothetical protein